MGSGLGLRPQSRATIQLTAGVSRGPSPAETRGGVRGTATLAWPTTEVPGAPCPCHPGRPFLLARGQASAHQNLLSPPSPSSVATCIPSAL